MKRGKSILIFALLNVAWASAVVYLLATRSGPVAPVSDDARSAVASSPRIVPHRAPTPLADRAASPTFNWRSVESSDFRQYIANLRAISCPEETIRDIILADINKLYASKTAPWIARAKDLNFWQGGDSKARLLADARRQLRELQKEKRELVRELLGADLDSEQRKAAGGLDPVNEELAYGFLPEAKRSAVREIAERYQELEQELRRDTTKSPFASDQAELKKLRAQRRAELAGVLTPQELEDYELRTSNAAENLRSRLGAVAVTEEEFRKLYRAQSAFEENNPSRFGPGADFSRIQERRQAQAQLDQDFQGILGDARFSELKLNQDLAYRGLTQVAQQYNLPSDTIGKVYEMKQVVENQVRQIMADRSLSRETRQVALNSVNDETQRALTETMGAAALEEYKRNGGFWLQGLNQGAISSAIIAGPDGAVQVMKTIGVNGPPGTPAPAGGRAVEDVQLIAPGAGVTPVR